MINSLELKNFTCFSDSELQFCKGINVLIGKNGTGKTHIMKCMAATLKANKQFKSSTSQSKDKYGELLTDAFISYFKPDSLGHLVNNNASESHISLKINSNILRYNFSSSMRLIKTETNRYIKAPTALYIPPREMFSLFDGFISLYEKREVSFDETYLDLAKALNAAPLKGQAYERSIELIQPLLDKWNIQVVKRNNRFYIIEEGKEYEAHLVAEGLRKMATMLYLVINGELKENSILFWDEPEANLNPSLISVVAELLVNLAKNGIQIFICTHDYLLTHRLSLYAEYPEDNSPEFSFFSLHKNADGITVETAKTLAEIQNNAILDEYAGFYDLESELIHRNNR
ncbi:MAG: AAA family ATPase [Macellibacteroides fermentans]|uniref:AAA family ATPase n=1 Tax=Macellibacteroides fermentans TaxID=879969 RepID=UPI003ACAB502